MAITANFGTYTGNPDNVSKTVQWGADITISAWDQIDDLTCDFILDGAGYHGTNMMKVNWNGTTKYYFIESRSGMTATRTKIRATCDVLYTYAQTIKDSPAILNRCSNDVENILNPMLKDNKVTTLSETEFDSWAVNPNTIGGEEFVYVGVLQKLASENITPVTP